MDRENEKLFNTKLQEPHPITLAVQTIIDVIVFLSVSIGFIIQDIFYKIFGYPEKQLTDELVLVTGGGGGLGRLLAVRLSKLGAKVIVWDINQEGIEETVALVKSTGGFCRGYRVDISKKEDVYKAADEIRRDIGNVDILINNAGVVSGRAFLDTPDYLIERSFNVNVLAHFWTVKAFLPSMLERDHGHIVTIASLAGHVGISKLVDYCSSKFAAVGFDEALRLEIESLGNQGVNTTCICPFFIQSTGMFDDVNARWVPTLSSEDVAERIISAVQKNEKIAIIPGYLGAMLAMKWIFPWGCTAGFLRRLVPDAAPQHGLMNGHPQTNFQKEPETINVSSSECKAEVMTAMNGSVSKNASLMIQRMNSMGERVL